MKHVLLFSGVLMYFQQTNAQITITQSDFPSADDTALISVSDDIGLDMTETGADYTWDYSTLHIASQRIDTFFNVSDASALYQLQYNNIIFEPDYASDYYYDLIGFDLAGISGAGITIEKPVGFVKITSGAVENVGLGLTLNGYEVPMAADTIDMEYDLPMTFGDSWASDSYIYVDLNPAFNGIFQRYQYRTSEVDGWGSITTRLGTFDVIRVRSELTYVDSVYIDLGFGGTWLELPTPPEVRYTWWSADNKVPIMKVVAQVIGGNETITSVEFKDHERNLLGVDESETSVIQLYPNPANGTVNITTETVASSVSIYTISGEEVLSLIPESTSLSLDVSNWASGVYTVKIVNTDGSTTARLVVE